MTHKKKYKSGNMPFSIYSSSVDTGYTAEMWKEMGGKFLDTSQEPYATIYFAEGTTGQGTYQVGKASINPLSPSSIGPIIESGSTFYGFYGVSVDNTNRKLYYTSVESSLSSLIYTSSLDGADSGSILDPGFAVRAIRAIPSQNKILYGEANGTDDKLHTASLDGSDAGLIVNSTNASMADGAFAYSTTTNRVYFRNYLDGSGNAGTIYTCSLDGQDLGSLGVIDGISGDQCEGMDVDEVNQKLYWTIDDSNTARIFSCSLDGTDLAQIYQAASIDEIRGIAVDPHAEKVYFSDWDTTNPRIYSCDLDGENAEEFFNPDASRVHGLSLALKVIPDLPGFDITNLHADTYGGIKDAPMQGPFTYQYVGGNQHRHIPLNDGTDRYWNRPELFDINLSSSGEIRVVGPRTYEYENTECLFLDGEPATNGSYLQLVSPTGLNWTPTSNAFTISAWFKTSGTESMIIVSKCSLATPFTLQYFLAVDGSGNIACTAGTESFPATSGTDYRDGKWHHVVLANDTTNFQVYVDGAPALAGTTGAKVVGTDPVVGGGFNATTPFNMFLGLIDEVSFWDAGFSAADVTELYDEGVPTDLTAHSEYTNLATWLRMGDGTGDELPTIIDQGPDGNDATLVTAGTPSTPASLQKLIFGTDSIYFASFLVPAALYTRGEVAKRPLNIANHKTYNPIGNYSSSYEIVQTTGRTSNNRAFVDQMGVGFIGDPSLPYSGSLVTQFVSGARDFMTGTALPTFTPQETVFVNRFNAPGGPDVSSRGVLDTYAEEYAPNNAMPWRNYTARSVLRSDLTRHTPQPEIPTRNSPYSTPDTASQDLPLKVLDVPNAVVRKVVYSLDDGSGGDIFTASFMYTDGPASPLTGRFFDEGNVHTVGTANPDYANGIAVDNWNKKIYWTEFATTDDIFSASFDGSDSGLINLNAGTVSGDVRAIAVSPYLGKVAWCNRNSTNNIVTSSLDGSDSGVIIGSLDDPYDLVIDDRNNKVYWIGGNQSTGPDEKIWSASLDGSDYGPLAPEIQSLLTPSIGSTYEITAVDLDRFSNTLYILGDFDNPASGDQDARIHKCNLEGRNASLVYTDLGASGFQPIDLQIDPWGNRLYIAQFSADKPLLSCSLDNPGTGSENLFGTCFAPPSSEAMVKFALAFSIPVPTTSSLPCGYVPTKYHTDNRNTRYYKQTAPTSSVENIITNLSSTSGIAIDSHTQQLFYTSKDVSTWEIRRSLFDGTDEVVLESAIPQATFPYHLAVLEDYLYWGTNDALKRRSINPGGASATIVGASDVDLASGIAIDCDTRKIYWADWSGEKVSRADLDGTNVEVIASGLGTSVQGVALDAPNYIYWALEGVNKIQRMRLPTGSVEDVAIYPDAAAPVGVKVDSTLGKIYWVNGLQNFNIQRANLDGTDVEELIMIDGYGQQMALDPDGGTMWWATVPENDYSGIANINRCNTPEIPLYDNGFVTHAIPQCSLQYSWIKASATTTRSQLQGYQGSGSY